ncbi:MAG: hypothetical protein J6A29_03460 [Clostridia bacterium]|nr:hypothetical protein [Clostridia bacterium]
MTKIEEQRKQAIKNAEAILEGKSQEEANIYISENLTTVAITKAFIAVYIKKYANEEKDKKWINDIFYKACYKEKEKKALTLCIDADNNPIYKMNKKGKAIPKKKKVNTTETQVVFDISGARKAFIEYFNITTKENAFKVKEKRTTKVIDEFEGIFGK